MAEDQKKFLDYEGLQRVWAAIKRDFLSLEAGDEKTQGATKAEHIALAEEVATKVVANIVGTHGVAKIFNEIDGGGAKFENTDGTASFVGVNESTGDGVGAQLYDINTRDNNKGTKIDIKLSGAYYTKGDASTKPAAERDIEENEIATKGDIQRAISSSITYKGMTTAAPDETIEEAATRFVGTPKNGDMVIVNKDGQAHQLIYNGNAAQWDEIGNPDNYVTDAELQNELSIIRGEISSAADERVEKEVISSDGTAMIFNEADGGGAKFENTDGTASFAGVNSDTNGGIGAQLYDIDVSTNQGAKLDVTVDGIYYTTAEESAKPASERHTEGNLLVTKSYVDAHEPEVLTEADINEICK